MMDTSVIKPTNWLDPLHWSQVFADASRPIEIDLGCGKGGFLLWAAGTRPTHNFLGVERQLVRIRKVDKKILRRQFNNVRLLRVEATYFVSKLLPARSVSVVHILFPDPWPKRRHHPRRLIQPAFLRELHRALRNEGVVNVATDDFDYFAHMEKVFVASGLFREGVVDVLPVEAQTDFEKVFLAQGKRIGRAKYIAR